MKSNKRICIVDAPGGSYLNCAMLLSPYFAKTYYHSVNISAFPSPALNQIGTGFKEIERMDNFWSCLDEIDIIIFPDGGFKDWGYRLRAMGKMVWGATETETLESSRSLFQELLQRVDLPVAKTQVIKGITNLKKALKNKKDKWIKISKWRQLIETYHYISWVESRFWLDELTFRLGPIGDTNQIEFIIQDSIESIAEIGSDGYNILGQMPRKQIWGLEVKDMGYIGKISSNNELPEPIKEVNDKFSPVMKAYNSRGFYSTEIRYTEKNIPYFTDICARGGCPPLSSVISNISNWNEIIPAGCNGELVEPKYKSTYVVEIILKSQYVKTGYLPVSYPEQYEQNITFKGAFKLDGKTFIVPFNLSAIDMDGFGSVMVNDDELDNAINRALEIAKSIECFELSYEMAALDIAKEEISRIEEALKISF
jgi:hypothetical protein